MRHEFKRSVVVARIKAAMRNSIVYCDQCGQPCTRFHVDHIIPCGLKGKDDTQVLTAFENSQLLCVPCHTEKTKDDVGAIAKAKRREFRHIGGKPARQRPIQSRPFQPSEKVIKRLNYEKLPLPKRRHLYEDKQ